ncbi:MAG: S53 family peptidase, partial [Candidatus Thermoplasmatota archaeon]
MSCRSERSIAFLLFVVLVVQVPSLRAADVQPIVGSVPPYVTQAADQGPADSAERLHLVVVLRMQDEATMRSLADSFRVTPLTHAQVIARFSPSITQSATVVAWLRSQSLNVTSVSDDRTLIEVEATVGLAEEAFGVSLHEYRVGNHTLLSSSSDPLVPADIAPGIQAIVGLSEAPLTTLLQLSSQASTLTSGSPPFGPADLRNAYDVTTLVSSTADGRGKAIAITGWGPADQVALNEYDSSFGLPAATITYHDPSGGASCGGGSNVEWDLDVQMEHAMSPGASIHSYCGSAATLSAMLTIIGRVVTDNTADVISQSWGTCEGFVSSATASAYETKLTEAAAQGQAFFTSSGDGGSRECTRFSSDQRISPSFPATAPHTTSVGGTALTMSGSSYSSESAWNTCTPCSGGAYAASGGGRSQYFSRPSWQSPAGAETMRASPDWSADADPATGVAVRSGGAWYQVGGTSVSSPMLAGLWGDLVSAGGRLGNAGPKIWGASSTDYATVFRDITTGTNGDFSAGPGYDFP